LRPCPGRRAKGLSTREREAPSAHMDETRTKKILREHAGLEGEILQEIAEALGNSGERLERALERLQESQSRIEELLRDLRDMPGGMENREIMGRYREEVALYNELRRHALQSYRYLIIHREAVGFRNHKLVQEKYQIPPAMTIPEP
jgi:dsDNA-specific endonuclease/ATPase MutS2